MGWTRVGVSFGALVLAIGAHQTAMAQVGSSGADSLTALSGDSLKSELESRFDAALAATNNSEIVDGDDPRYLWALEAKAQCGIALGYLKSSTEDPASISKCGRAFELMQMMPPAPAIAQSGPAPVAPGNRPEQCANELVGTVFFEFNSAIVPAQAAQTINYARDNVERCGWTGFSVVGHADRAGSDAYNFRLSQNRAEAVANAMSSAGIPANIIGSSARGEEAPRVATDDGVREPQNRRVEITAR